MWSDTESKEDYLNFGEVSQIVTEILESEAMLPVSIGIFGNWGAGKSSLLNLIEQQIKPDEWIIIKFDAWLYQGFDDARAALLETIASHLIQAAKDEETILQKSKNLFARINGLRLLGLMVEGAALAAGVPTFGLISKTFETAKESLDGVQNETESKQIVEVGKNLIKPKEKQTPPQQIDEFRKEYGEILQDLGKKLVIVIDNLDRCLPANAIQTLEAIRLFLFLNRTAFIIAADEEMIRHSVAEHYKDLSYRHQIDYLDKLIQIPIRVPKAGVLEIRAYLYMLYSKINIFTHLEDSYYKMFSVNIENQNWLDKIYVDYVNQEAKKRNILSKTKEEIKNLNKSLERKERFLKLFNPELNKIEFEKKDFDENYYEIEYVFNYKDYKINFEYESMGMKSLFRLFDVLDTINNGGIVFVDEIDMSIHDLYLNRLIEFFAENGKGQFVFTAHNTSILDTLRKYKNSIDFMTEYQEIKPWIKNGNYSPRKQYLEGMLPNMPYNIEYYDFFEIFNTFEEEN